MATQYLIKYPLSIAIPEEVAVATPEVELDKFDAPPLTLASGKVILINSAFDYELLEYILGNNRYMLTAFLETEHQNKAVIHEDNTISCLLTIDDELDPVTFAEFLTPYGISFEPVTA
jgi:hypothetical protein